MKTNWPMAHELVSSEDAADEDGADAADGGGGPSEEHAVAM